MKSNISIPLLIIVVMILGVLLIRSNARENSLRRDLSIEDAKKAFSGRYDSLYAKNDTVRFYKNDSFIGMTVTITE